MVEKEGIAVLDFVAFLRVCAAALACVLKGDEIACSFNQKSYRDTRSCDLLPHLAVLIHMHVCML